MDTANARQIRFGMFPQQHPHRMFERIEPDSYRFRFLPEHAGHM
ncbi:hypothetical protein [Paraburkholderia sediminicola]